MTPNHSADALQGQIRAAIAADLERIVWAHLRAHGGRRPAMSDVTVRLGYSPLQVRRALAERCSAPLRRRFREMLCAACLTHAADMIGQGTKIEAALRLSGFRGKANFNRQFKKCFGCLPHELRARN
jgi:AraC-like DNA-binding protein